MHSVVGIVLGNERRMVAVFSARGAVTPEQALTLEQLGIEHGLILRRLMARAVIREAAPDRFYLDEASWNAVRRSRRRAARVAAVVALALMLALLFGTRRAAAGLYSGNAQTHSCSGDPQHHRC